MREKKALFKNLSTKKISSSFNIFFKENCAVALFLALNSLKRVINSKRHVSRNKIIPKKAILGFFKIGPKNIKIIKDKQKQNLIFETKKNLNLTQKHFSLNKTESHTKFKITAISLIELPL